MATESDVLRRVRALLDKAESTDFEAEREALVDKAQDLILRYAIDEAAIAAERPTSEKPIYKEVVIGENLATRGDHARVRASLLSVVAKHNRVRAVFLKADRAQERTQLSGLVGFTSDIEFVELLFTSLLLQMTRNSDAAWKALPEEEKAKGAGWRYVGYGKGDNGGSYRRTRKSVAYWKLGYYWGFVRGVSERLAKQNEQTEAEVGSKALVLVDRAKVVDDAFAERFPIIGQSRRGVYASGGYDVGKAAAYSADISGGARNLTRNPAIGGR